MRIKNIDNKKVIFVAIYYNWWILGGSIQKRVEHLAWHEIHLKIKDFFSSSMLQGSPLEVKTLK